MTTISTARKRAEQALDIDRVVENMLHGLEIYCRHVRPCVTPDFFDKFRTYTEKHPPRIYSRKPVAVHEAGHFGVMHAEGFGPSIARLRNKSREGFGWFGRTWADRASNIQSPPSEILRDAISTLAGPLSEERHGDASCRAAENIEELCGAYFLTMHAAHVLGWSKSKGQLWQSTLIGAAARVEFYGQEIRELADVLAKRCCIHVTDKDVKRILGRIDGRPFNVQASGAYNLSPRGAAMIGDINETLKELLK